MIDPRALPRADGSNSAVAGYTIDKAVLNGIRSASRATGMDFGYLMAQAAQESSFQASAGASGSSAKGLFQFIDSTWLRMMRDHGAKYGYGALAQQISTGADGAPVVGNKATRQHILDLRSDPQLAATLGAEYARSNKQQLEQALDRPAKAADLYLAHFMGAGGAADFLKAMHADGNSAAAKLFPKAAAANPAVFYDADGKARSLYAIYSHFDHSITSKANAFAALGSGDAIASPLVPAVAATSSSTGASSLAAQAFNLVPSSRGFGRPVLSLPSIAALTIYEALGRLKLPGETDPPHGTTKT